MTHRVERALLDAVVRAAVEAQEGEPWESRACDVRARCERRLALPADALAEHRADVFSALLRALGAVAEPAAEDSDPVAECVRALLQAPADAQKLLGELEASLSDPAAAQAALAPKLNLVAFLSAHMLSEEPEVPLLSLRALTALSMHGGGATTALMQARGLRDGAGLLDVLLGWLPRAEEVRRPGEAAAGVAQAQPRTGRGHGDLQRPHSPHRAQSLSILVVALLNNLADSAANLMRLIGAGTLAALTRVVLEPAASATLKEHALSAAAATGGLASEEVSFPQVVGRMCGSRLPGTQREAVRAMLLLTDRPELRPQLASVSDVSDGLRAAAASRDAAAAAGAAEALELLGLCR